MPGTDSRRVEFEDIGCVGPFRTVSGRPLVDAVRVADHCCSCAEGNWTSVITVGTALEFWCMGGPEPFWVDDRFFVFAALGAGG